MSGICVVEIHDEVNCRVTGLDARTNRKLVSALKFKLPHARHLPNVKMGRWDGCMDFYSVGGKTFVHLLDKLLPIVQDAGYQFDIQDRRPAFEFNHELIDKDFLSDCVWPETHPRCPNQAIELFPHQVEIINNFIQNPQAIQSAPTSAGKTITCAALCRIAEPYGRTITIVPNNDLVNQTHADYQMIGLDVGRFDGKFKDWYKPHTVCTWQSLSSLLKRTQNGVAPEDKDIIEFAQGVNCVIVDEAHGLKGNELKTLMTRVFNQAQIRWAVTGTIPKEPWNEACLRCSVGNIIQGPTAKDLQDVGVLANCDICILQLQLELDSATRKRLRVYADERNFLHEHDDSLQWLSAFVEEIKANGNTLILVNLKKTGRQLQQLIPNSVFIEGAVKSDDRKEHYDSVATEQDKVIIATYSLASVGINIPRIFNLILYEPGKSFVKTIQSIGRGLRRAHDKDRVDIFDICFDTKYSKRHLNERKKFYQEFEYPFKLIKTKL
jgi:superfamily II DNA or RNA helicase